MLFDNSLPQLYYLGFVRKEHFSKVQSSLSAIVYEHWDGLKEAGPRTRPREDEAGPCPVGLKVLALSSDGSVGWPESLFSRFPEGSVERLSLEKKRDEFFKKFPNTSSDSKDGTSGSTHNPTPSRSAAKPDYSIDGGIQPLDPMRVIDLAGVPASSFTAERLLAFAFCCHE